MTSAQICIIIAIAVYLIAMVFVGVAYSRASKGGTDSFYLGGRQLGPVVTAMSAEASDMSSWLLMGLPGVAYFTGIADAAWTAIGLALGTYLNFLLVAKRLRIYSAEINAITVPEFFSKRFKDDKKVLLGISALIILIFFIPYTASGFAAIGKLFNSLFGFDYMISMLIGAAVVILYTIMGGFLAVSTTDLIQSIVMTIALIVVLGFGIEVAGGWGAVTDNARSIPGYLSLVQMTDISTGEVTNYGFIKSLSMLAWGLGYFGMPHILLRFMGISDAKKIKISRRIGSIWVVISMTVAVTIGITGLAMSKVGEIETFGSSSAAEAVIVKIADLLSTHGVLAALAAGLIIAGILASTMSTADSQLLAASSSVSEDLVKEVRVGRLRCHLRARHADRSVLEAHHQVGRAGRYDLWRRHGVHLEVSVEAHGRRVGHLRAAARLHRGAGLHRRGVPADQGSRRRHRGHLRQGQGGVQEHQVIVHMKKSPAEGRGS